MEDLAFVPWAPIQDVDRVSVVKSIAGHHGATPRQVVLAWLLARSSVMLPIPGTATIAHLEENIVSVGLTLSVEEIDALTRAG